MKPAIFIFVILFIITSCVSRENSISPSSTTTYRKNIAGAKKPVTKLEIQCLRNKLVNVHLLDTNIVVDLKYSTTDNFMGYDMYGDFDKAYLQKDIAAKLVNAPKFLMEKKPGYRLVIYDATRPRSIQQKMWDTLKMPFAEKIKFVSNPKNGSLHNFGAAVDVSIIDNKGVALDMGTPYDYMGELAYPDSEKKMLSQGKLTQQQIDNRKLLRSVMYRAGFFNIQTEWWHFNACTWEQASAKYKIIE